MEILTHRDYHNFINFLPLIKNAVKEWQLVDVRLADNTIQRYTIQQVADIMQAVFKEKNGKIYIGNDRALCMLISSGFTPEVLTQKVEASLPGGACHVTVGEANSEGLKKLELHIMPKSDGLSAFASARFNRHTRVMLIADDDMYVRTLVKKGAQPHAEIHEIGQGNEVLEAYKKYIPDLLLLDIHMPGKTGLELLNEILELDPEAYIVMLSADSSQENVLRTTQTGAKGFMTKPFNKDKLIGYMKAAHIC